MTTSEDDLISAFKKMRRSLLAVPAAAALVLGLTGSAQAHYVYEWTETWRSGDGTRCLQNRSEISDGNNSQGYIKGDATSLHNSELTPLGCTNSYEVTSGYLWEYMAVFKWNETAGEWNECMYTDGWYSNSSTVYKYQIYAYSEDWGGWCGKGSYGLMNFSEMVYNGKNVFPDGVPGIWSGYHDGLGISQASSSSSPPAPEWVDENGVVDPDQAPDTVKVLGSDGEVATDGDGNPIEVDPMPATPSAETANTDGGVRTLTTDDDGLTTEKVAVDLTRPQGVR
ncbi:hypothetical protein [Streptomyces sp. S584]|uniref:hypothetical protein n=1 Tax=Streptomyces sp. S584 TaxID=3096010 RepID=UPI002AFF8D1D|nr:hypothetical protein [Streptomyces sp. S584]